VLPDSPSALATDVLMHRCRRVYENRNEIVASYTLDKAREELRRAMAIERYVTAKGHKDAVRRAARVLETAVGEALGDAPGQGARTDLTTSACEPRLDSGRDAQKFRLMASHRDLWWPTLAEKALSRRQVLTMIDEANRPRAIGPGDAQISEMAAEDWLAGIHGADLLLTDPPYSTDVVDVGEFAASWLPAAFEALASHGRAFVFIGAYAEELGAYFSQALPDGWQWGVPHAWCYRNAIGPTPEFDFIRNWQCLLTARGPDAYPMRSDRITDLLAGYVENAPDGRHETKLHRWQKPLTVIDRLIRVASEPDNVVIDPFAGSGTTLIAAREAGRRGFGCDTDPDAVKTCIARGCHEG
jgi:hypothetical protein